MIGIETSSHRSIAPVSLPIASPVRSLPAAASGLQDKPKRSTDEIREKFTEFVGQTFYGQLIKSMRTSVGKPAYFHGGRGEEVFQGQLDQQFAEHMTKASADKFADPLFRRQFPQLAARESEAANDGLAGLNALSRR